MLEAIQLPDALIFLEKLEAMDELPKENLKDEQKWLFDAARRFQVVVDNYTNTNEYIEDPQIVADTLERYRRYSGGLLGLAIALHRRAKFLDYEGLTEESRSPNDPNEKKQRLGQGDREQYARGRHAALEGLVRMLEEQHEALEGRVFRVGSRGGARTNRGYSD